MRNFKIIVLGDYQVGKTSLINRFVFNEFSEFHYPTIGFNIIKKVVQLNNDKEINIVFWDTGGLTIQKDQIKEKIFKSVDAVIIVIQSTINDFILAATRWYEYVKTNYEFDIPIFIISTKSDLIRQKDTIKTQFNSLPEFSVSAKTGNNLSESFLSMIKIIKSHYQKIDYSIESKYRKYNLESKEIENIERIEEFLVENYIPYVIYNLSKLEKEGFPLLFGIDNNSFGITVKNGNITGIGLFNCNLKTLPDFLENFKFLKRITLRCNPLNKVPSVLLNLRNIEFLDLALTDLSFVPEDFGKLNKLVQLHLENNKLVLIPDSIGNLQLLKFLNLANNPISSLPTSISNLANLRDLNLEAPAFFFKGDLKELPDNFGKLKALRKLDLSSCNLTYLPNSFGNLEGLRILDLYDNKLTTIPESIGNLKLLENLNLENNKLISLPDSLNQLLNLKSINLKNNPLRKKGSEKFKALALKATGEKYERLMSLSETCKLEEDFIKGVKRRLVRKRIGFIKSLVYASLIALIGTITFINVNIVSLTSNFLVWLFFLGSLIINLLIGACIIATLSRYLKISVIVFRWRIYKYFDIFVILYLIWSIRAAVKILLSIELIPSINFIFEFSIPKSFLNLLVNFGYNLDLTFLENLDLFFGHFYLKIFSTALVFWALYRNGFKYIKKTAFEEKERKNVWIFLIVGLFGAFSLAVMNYSNLKPFLSIGYDLGVIFGGWLFIWEKNRPKKSFFLCYIILIFTGICLIWLISLWSMLFSLVFCIVFIILYFIIRRVQNKKLSLYIY
ncbi:MAG: GTP-binding protein [Promethearchaeota archaeon]